MVELALTVVIVLLVAIYLETRRLSRKGVPLECIPELDVREKHEDQWD